MGKNYTFVRGAAFPYQYKYEHPAVTTDCVIFTYEDWKLKVLLVKRGGEPYKGKWALPGGFLQNDETAMEGALRELREETGLAASAVVELGVFSDPNRDPRERVITIAFYALVKPSEVVGGDDADEAAWFPIDELPQLAFDHADIINAAMERIRRDIHFEPIGFDLPSSPSALIFWMTSSPSRTFSGYTKSSWASSSTGVISSGRFCLPASWKRLMGRLKSPCRSRPSCSVAPLRKHRWPKWRTGDVRTNGSGRGQTQAQAGTSSIVVPS